MISAITLLLCVNLASSILPLSLLVRDCDQVEKIDIDGVTSFMNPNFPSSYNPGTICRWVFECHVGYACRLICRSIGLPLSENCSMDKILVSTQSGDPTVDGSRVYCGGMTINAKSEGARISMMLIASESSLGGRFMCTVRSEPAIYSQRE
ncbi:unnamed protein product [Arctia plantaginis]|nr:unnamed protein product [Arctia plantaginis]